VRDRLHPGQYSFRYYTAEGTTLINCGDTGLTASRVAGLDPQVQVKPLKYAQPA